jgi:hypothetical protein
MSKKGAMKTAEDFLKDKGLSANNLAEMTIAKNAFAQINKQRAAKAIDDLI